MKKEERRAYMKKWRAAHPDYWMNYYLEHRDEYSERHRDFLQKDLNSYGENKGKIRLNSRRILFKTHCKLTGYQIHHCFGYEDPKKFIYIPKDLHIQVHELLRDKNIPADSDHWNIIRDLVNSCDQYTYIRA